MKTVRRISYVFLFASLPIVMTVVGLHALRVPGVYQTIGGVLFAAMALAAWNLGARAIRGEAEDRRLLTSYNTICARCASLGRPWPTVPGKRGREPDAVSGPHCHVYRDRGWIRHPQRSTQRSW